MNIAQQFLDQSRRYLMADYLPKIESCLEVLSDEDVWWRANEESNSIGNLLLHLAGNVRQWITGGVGGLEMQRDRRQEFAERELISRAELLTQLRRTVTEADQVLANLDAARLDEWRQIQRRDVTILEAIFHVVEHFSMHTGQIIMITKMRGGRDLKFFTG